MLMCVSGVCKTFTEYHLNDHGNHWKLRGKQFSSANKKFVEECSRMRFRLISTCDFLMHS